MSLWSQADYYTKRKVVIKGYDVTEYFNNTPTKGLKKHRVSYDNANFYFASKENKKKFKENPEQFIPQYGGYCAYALGVEGKKVSINPKTFEIREGKLYLFYNKGNTNTLDLWTTEGAEQLKIKADKNWKKINNQ